MSVEIISFLSLFLSCLQTFSDKIILLFTFTFYDDVPMVRSFFVEASTKRVVSDSKGATTGSDRGHG